jgi:hypothetical protein
MHHVQHEGRIMINKLIATAAVLMACAASLQADPITGSTGFTGSYTASNSNLTTANDVITITSASINGIQTGSFVGAVLTSFSSPITINSPVNPTFVEPLWSETVGTHVFSFVSTSDTTLLDTPNINVITGTGTITDSSDGDTVSGTYNMSFNVSGATFTWNGTSATTPTVPDSGSAVALLGIALAGIEGVRRALRARRA